MKHPNVMVNNIIGFFYFSPYSFLKNFTYLRVQMKDSLVYDKPS